MDAKVQSRPMKGNKRHKKGRLHEPAAAGLPWYSGYRAAVAVTVLLVAILGGFAFTEFKIGTFQTETDFYWSYWPKAEAFSRGEWVWGDFRPPFYSMMLAVTHGFIEDYYRAGMVLSLLSALAVGLCCYGIFRRIWGDGFALAAVALLMVHPEFTRHAYCPGTDMFFVAICSAGVLLSMQQWNVLAGVLMGLAFMTRYNGIFLVPVALWFSQARGRWLTGFVAVAGAFAVMSYLITGSIYPNRNYLNVAYMLFGEHEMSWDQFWYLSRDVRYTSLSQVLLLDPWLTVRSMVQNIGTHGWLDMRELALYPVAGLAIVGLIRDRRVKELRPLLWYGLGLFLILCLVFYSERFSLFLLLIYIPLALRGLTWFGERFYFWRSSATLL